MKIKNYLLIVILLLPFIGCSNFIGPQGEQGPYDKQIRFEIKMNSQGINDTIWVGECSQGLLKFNIDHYIGVDSAIFFVELRSSDNTTKCMARLFNYTDNIPILSSYVETNSTNYIWVESGNLFHDLPKKEITLTIQAKSSQQGVSVIRGWAYLILYRK